ncbi:hypothetical protein LHGZ1_3420 [Laribacter hongkongensis]|uniref:Uncharacterized protein n=1 Tax=Laribacter hongkongensis TaxID=168471 RepID=A0A248LP72_9NEIS|nr:hypothetical protein LHGZ1_3420 [Laribacter hongkongensis]
MPGQGHDISSGHTRTARSRQGPRQQPADGNARPRVLPVVSASGISVFRVANKTA